MMRKTLSIVLFLLSGIVLLTALRSDRSDARTIRHEGPYGSVLLPADLRLIRHGDVIFRRGQDFTSEVVLRVDSASPFSHIGIVVERPEGLFVVHATPAEEPGEAASVRADPIEYFADHDRASSVGIYRLGAGTAEISGGIAANAAAEAWRIAQARLLFDADFDLDTKDRFYCTELVWHAYLFAGVRLVTMAETTKLPFRENRILLPSALQNSERLVGVLRRDS